MTKLMDVLGFGGGGKNNLPPKDHGRRNLWLAGLAVLGIILLVFSGLSGSSTPAKETQPQELKVKTVQVNSGSSMSAEEKEIAEKLCEMLRQVKGAGAVEVSVRLFSSTRAEYAINTTAGKKTTQERDQSGGTRLTTEDTGSGQLVMNRNGTGAEQPVVERETAPQVAGVLVVAEGAGNARVKLQIFEAARVALGIEPHKILVLPKERRG